jgi:UDP-N-acetylglucosamine diphosphorylase/glucosamine-1-phosphate N-acetyltransferase
MSQALYLFDDASTRDWNPFTLTRPVGELFFGALLLRERSESYWSFRCLGHVTRATLTGFSEVGSPPAVLPDSIGQEGYRVFQNSRVALSGEAPKLPSSPSTLYLRGKVVGWALPPGAPTPPPELFEAPEPIPGTEPVDVYGTWFSAPFDLMARNSDQLREDVPALFPGYATDEVAGCHVLGDGLLSLGSKVQIDPGSVFDVRNGPIRLSNGVVVKSHTRLEGPSFIGADSTLLGGSLSELTVGPVCKVRGEVESSIILGYSNKAHDGFLGHAYLGRWVNLGAFTTNSDLKNNYGPVRIGGPDGVRDTGLMKVGCFLGDHVKTGIGTYLNTGTVVGAGSNIFGGKMPPTYVPPFSWGTGQDLTEFRLDKFLEVATRAMGRRDVQLDEGMEAVLTRAFENTRRLRNTSGGGGGA